MGLWWEMVRPDVFAKVAVTTKGGWRVDKVVGQRGKWGGGYAIIQDRGNGLT